MRDDDEPKGKILKFRRLGPEGPPKPLINHMAAKPNGVIGAIGSIGDDNIGEYVSDNIRCRYCEMSFPMSDPKRATFNTFICDTCRNPSERVGVTNGMVTGKERPADEGYL